MELQAGVMNYGEAPVYSVDGIASVELISANKIRVTYFLTHVLGHGETVRRACLSIDWDADVWTLNRATIGAMILNHTRDKTTNFSVRN